MKVKHAAWIVTSTLAGAAVLTAAAVAAALMQRERRRASKPLPESKQLPNAAQLRDKVVLITGSSRGLGLALAEEFGHHGAKLVLTARDSDELERARLLVLERTSVEPNRIMTMPADLRRPEEVQSLVQRATEHFGGIDILVNNAGVIAVGPIESQTIENFRNVMDMNFFSGVQCSMMVLPQMLSRRDGVIVNISSVGGKVAVPHLLPYTASKFAVTGFSQGLHAELRAKGIHVLTVCPGLMRTGSHLNALFSGDAPREYRWFSLLANLPGVSSSAQDAARTIVSAVISKSTEISITPQATVVSRVSQVLPELTACLSSATNRFLPNPGPDGSPVRRGGEVRELELMPAATVGWSVAQHYNQIG
ncbi:MAG TPA: SDR family NAD(P)-dependent oxidoreductase [Acidobacteriaceae bacterium]|nr:SDR family NAD(P)-dependent oxidoreductase [Acidobacteriaceae bacterium]